MGSSKIPRHNVYDAYKDDATNIYMFKTNGVVCIELERSTITGTVYEDGDKICDIPESFLPRGNGFSFREVLNNIRLSVSNTSTRKGLYALESTHGYNIRGCVTYVTD